MTISYIKYSLVDGFIHQWLTAGPLFTDVPDLILFKGEEIEAGIYRKYAAPELEVNLPPVDSPGALH